ncbi:hypothetical protein QA639_21595 [Bradyrhizobium pachyrhizi]|uniref:hypothetical protein n=1 Tax=Bradyrhizobium pachyrhizi TaxID=280333 RepID=UPI0024B1F0AB|nr:hypothetical protein [Bradyrhizobium pachyrhizi]WFU52304.1 hypothetical protein QA639_21595 [Bradyrhizobium pachyrhizi]
MADIVLELKAEQYFCEPCSLKQGTLVRELVRMIPKSVVLFDKLVGDEYYCCPICFEPKFTVKGKKKVKHGQKAGEVAAHPEPRSEGERPAGPVLVKS